MKVLWPDPARRDYARSMRTGSVALMRPRRRPFMRLLAAFPTRVRHDGAVALFALATFARAGCTHHAYRDPATTVDESATVRLLGVSPGDLPTPIPGRKSELGSRAR